VESSFEVRALTLATLASLILPASTPAAVIVARPTTPVYICAAHFRHAYRCKLRWDAGALIGLTLPAAQRVAQVYGQNVRRVAPLAPHEAVTADFKPNRVDVETDSTAADSTVVRVVGIG